MDPLTGVRPGFGAHVKGVFVVSAFRFVTDQKLKTEWPRGIYADRGDPIYVANGVHIYTNHIFVMAETDPATSSLEARAPEYEALRDAFERLHDTICPEGVTVTLFSRHLLSKVEADTIRSKATTHGQNEELLYAIFRRSPAQVLQFCQFLLEKQSHCGNILKEGES